MSFLVEPFVALACSKLGSKEVTVPHLLALSAVTTPLSPVFYIAWLSVVLSPPSFLNTNEAGGYDFWRSLFSSWVIYMMVESVLLWATYKLACKVAPGHRLAGAVNSAVDLASGKATVGQALGEASGALVPGGGSLASSAEARAAGYTQQYVGTTAAAVAGKAASAAVTAAAASNYRVPQTQVQPQAYYYPPAPQQ
jgi:hypothetical protein